MPKYIYLIPILLLLFLINFYLLTKIKRSSRKKKHSPFLLNLMSLFVVLPTFNLIVFLIVSLVFELQFWNPIIKTYLFGTISFMFLIQVFIAIGYLFGEIVLLIIKLKDRILKSSSNTSKISSVFNKTAWILGIIFFLYFLYGMIFTAFDYQIKKVDIQFHKLPQKFDELKIVQISDLHLGTFYGTKPLKLIQQKIDSLHPDIVFFTGDLVNYATDEAVPFVEIMKDIRAPMGVYAIMGNHDYGEYVHWKSKEEKQQNLEQLYTLYRNVGWKLLRNEHVVLTKDTNQIVLAGVENWGASRHYPHYGNLKQALVGADSSMFTILLSHDPSHWEKVVSEKYPQVNLTLSGHTHAMQMGFISKGKEWSPATWFYKYWGGFYENEKYQEQYLYINRGTGMIGIPARIGLGPEITFITLRKK